MLGSTGSIGRQALNCIRRYPDRFEVVSLAAGSNARLLVEQAQEFSPKIVCIEDENGVDISSELPKGCEFFCGKDANLSAVIEGCDLVFVAIMGFAGLKCVLKAIDFGKNVAIANKETLVAGGEIVTRLAKEKGVELIPVDSEHSAIWQSLSFDKNMPFKRLIITASGGAFRDRPIEDLPKLKAADALLHPN